MNPIQKIRQKGSLAFNHLRSTLGFNRQLFQHTPGARALIYHGICRGKPTLINSLFITAKTFEEHLKFYRRYFNIVSLDDFYAKNYNDDRFAVCLTFDDGFANNYRYVLPLIEKYKIPVTFFITAIRQAGHDVLWNDQLALLQRFGPPNITFNGDMYVKDKYRRYLSRSNGSSLRDHLQQNGYPLKAGFLQQTAEAAIHAKARAGDDYWLQMTEKEITMLTAHPLVTIGCHGYYHNDLSRIPLTDATDEMIHSRQYLESITGCAIDAIAFPYGAYTKELTAAAVVAGFRQLLAVDFRHPQDKDDPTIRERMTINPYISVYNQMTAIVRGHYHT